MIKKHIDNEKGFTLPETLIAFLMISLIVVWVTQIISSIRFNNNSENNRIVAVMRNMEIMEVIRGNLNDTGEIKRLSSGELTGGNYQNDVYYSTTYEKFESSTGGDLLGKGGRSIKEILGDILDVEKRPEMAELLPNEGGNSELYFISINTTVAKSRFKRNELSSFLYTNSSPSAYVKSEDMVMWLSANGRSNYESNKDIWVDRTGESGEKTLEGFDFGGTSGWTGESLLFDGVNDTVNLGKSVRIKPSKFSIELYVRPENKGSRHVVMADWGNVGGGVRSGYTVEILADGRVSFGLNSTKTYLTTSEKVEWDNYVHIVATYDGVYQRVYINGDIAAEERYTNTRGYSADNTVYLSSIAYDLFKGNIGEVRMYSEGLSSQEVRRNYIATVGGK